ncbi:MAG: ABC transporter permease, partial [Armatimonadota bacterium]|nr:ABC transporter permease [Armatimonadota bacterium]
MATSVATPKPAAQRLSTQQILTALGPFLGLALVIVLFSLVPDVRPYFLSPGNFALVATQTVIVALGALGMTLIIISGGIDLSVGSVIALASVATALLLAGGQSVVVALLAAILVGCAVGAVNG